MNVSDMTPDQVREMINTPTTKSKTIKKDAFSKFLTRYGLNGFIDTAFWSIKDNNISVETISGGSEVMVFLETAQFPFEDCSFVVKETRQLKSMLELFLEDLEIGIKRDNKGNPNAFTMTDGRISANFALGMEINRPKFPYETAIIKEKMTKLDDAPIIIQLDLVTITALIKSGTVLSDEQAVTLLSDGENAKLVVGYEERRNTTNLTLPLTMVKNSAIEPVRFTVDVLRQLLNANRDATEVTWAILPPRMSRMVFTVAGVQAQYIIIPRDK